MVFACSSKIQSMFALMCACAYTHTFTHVRIHTQCVLDESVCVRAHCGRWFDNVVGVSCLHECVHAHVCVCVCVCVLIEPDIYRQILFK
jgi:hypothetical protein